MTHDPGFHKMDPMMSKTDIDTATGAPMRQRRARMRRALDLGLWVLVIGLFGWRFGPQLLAATGVGGIDDPAPAFEVVSLSGQRISSETLRGKVVLVNFWATWCAPCRLEMPAFERVYRARAEEGLEVIGLSTDVTGDDRVQRFIAERDISYPVAMAPPGLARAFGSPRAIPTTFLIDKRGVIRYRITGYFAEPALRLAVSRLLAESGLDLEVQTESQPPPSIR